MQSKKVTYNQGNWSCQVRIRNTGKRNSARSAWAIIDFCVFILVSINVTNICFAEIIKIVSNNVTKLDKCYMEKY